MNTCQVRLQAREEVAGGTMAFHFQRPTDFAFKAGQAIDLILPAAVAADGANQRHAFSLVNAPFENELVIATRMRDSVFKRALKMFPIGGQVEIEGPFGSLTLHNERARPAIFIAGGIGITPFMSVLRQATHDRLPQEMVLLYSNRRPEDAAFLLELQNLARQNANFQLLPTMTEMDKSDRPWQGETSHISKELLRKTMNGLQKPVFYAAGPPGLVAAMREVLNRVGVNDDDIRSEEFYGY
ncbi:FAD-dependent oxidoreductase [Polaromonas jejuensis]|uniref:FAD-dependent oxidoreductase n=1 Tax=Polaromonas jejuensis TaxID=457502 RepID=A0ABW0QBN5_9BURK|nr:FAD-dependent oxidoreductase [Polaromonas jejuensis]